MSANDLTLRHEAELLELALWGMQAWCEDSQLDPRQFEALILLASDVRVELARVEEEKHARFLAERAQPSAPAPVTPPTPLSVVK